MRPGRVDRGSRVRGDEIWGFQRLNNDVSMVESEVERRVWRKSQGKEESGDH